MLSTRAIAIFIIEGAVGAIVSLYAPAWINLMANLGLSCPADDFACLRSQSIGVFVILIVVFILIDMVVFFIRRNRKKNQVDIEVTTIHPLPSWSTDRLSLVVVNHDSRSVDVCFAK